MRRFRGDRGATVVEFAFVMPLLLLLAFGTAEMGLAWTANNRIEGATSTAARIGSSSGSLAEADRSVLVSLKSSLGGEQLDRLDRVVIFESDVNGTIPAGCIKAEGSTSQAGVSGACNTYSGDTVRAVTTTSVLGTADDFWAPSTRKDTLAGPPDYVGVYVRTGYGSKTGTFFDDMTITKTSVYRIQPDIDG